nr:tyrosine-type recombinase/integrase [Bathymodiolus thermophilus thioautotrophic gill symbiont]
MLSKKEVAQVLILIDGMVGLVVELLHVGGLRISEVACLRVQDIDFEFKQITVWDGKGKKDWVTPLANNLILPLKIHLIKGWHPLISYLNLIY